MKSSIYNIFVEPLEQEGSLQTVLYNSLYGSLTLWDHDELPLVRQLLEQPDQFSNKAPEIFETLVDQGNLIDSSVDEIEIAKNRKHMGVIDENRLDVIIMPTLECNFACVYCYENHPSGKMSQQVEAAIRKWLQYEIPKRKVLMLHWFGGEPLMALRQVLSITNYASQVASKSESACIFHMTTNGYLLNQNRIVQLIEAGIRDYQITLDGTAETHNKLRILKNGKPTFDRLYQNIIDLARADKNVKISIRVNFNHQNIQAIPELLDIFPKDIRAQLRMVYEPVFGSCSYSATDNLKSTEISESIAHYYQKAAQQGYDVVLGQSAISPGKLVYCYAERKNQFIINYTGDIYKCSVNEFLPQERVGFISDDGVFVKEQENWNKWVNDDFFEDDCYSCIYLPLCMGGCRKMRIQKKGKGSFCSLVPTNTTYILKQIAFGGFENMLRHEYEGEAMG